MNYEHFAHILENGKITATGQYDGTAAQLAKVTREFHEEVDALNKTGYRIVHEAIEAPHLAVGLYEALCEPSFSNCPR